MCKDYTSQFQGIQQTENELKGLCTDTGAGI